MRKNLFKNATRKCMAEGVERNRSLFSRFYLEGFLGTRSIDNLNTTKPHKNTRNFTFQRSVLLNAQVIDSFIIPTVIFIHYGLIENVSIKAFIAVAQSIVEYILFFYTCYYFAVQGKYFIKNASEFTRNCIKIFFVVDIIVITGIGVAVFVENFNADPDSTAFCQGKN